MASRELSRAERLNELKELYLKRAFSDAELAERFGVDRATIYRDRITLERRYPFIKESPGRYRLDQVQLLSTARLNAHEALRLYLVSGVCSARRPLPISIQPAQPKRSLHA